MAYRFLIDARRLADFGIGTYIRNLVHALAGIDRENHYILAALRPHEPDLMGLPENFEIVANPRPVGDRMDHLAFYFFVKRLRPDLVHMPLNAVPFCMPRPYVVTIHDMGSLLFGGKAPRAYEDARLYLFKRGLMRAEKVIAVSGSTRRDVERILGVPSHRVRQIYDAPDPRFGGFGQQVPPEEKQLVLERYQINYPFILYAGTIRPQKNIPRLVEAFAVLRGDLEGHPEYHDLHLIIIGDEISRYPSVRRAVIQTRVENAVRFLGFVPFETLRVFFEAASAFAFPSLYEGFGLPPLEAMASGTPVVVSNTSSLPEVVGNAAELVNPENVFEISRALREVLTNEALREELRRRGYEQVRRFSWENTAREVLDIYTEVARNRKR